MSKLSRLPVTFSETGTLDGKDVRFINVTIDVLHTGDNRNGSTFDKETVDIAANSIKNTPILGYIEQNQVDEKDFKGHEHKLIIDDDGIKYVYAGSAYGVIPESCNPRWIKKCDDKGVEREYFRVDGLLWTKFDDACDIFKRDLKKNHSMEITNIEGYVDDRGYYVVSNFQFDGCCILSTTNPHIQPAMTGSDIHIRLKVIGRSAVLQGKSSVNVGPSVGSVLEAGASQTYYMQGGQSGRTVGLIIYEEI